ncbi:replication protein RepA [Alkalimonas collagenimarina]|uniref:Replication protein RepA n=1 Tax=Alkalimonas collagenimarina TaxID=400390 RepID=A0ABT9GY92_9GAMM|nr:replication protein RepA [Alkalimonas collagenimarina]MDP4536026.1 replication protein RepA [Alkalimonas collagenimarina]
MGLRDLRKKSTPSEKPKVSVDDFIEDANNYAMGLPKVVSLRQQLPDEEQGPRLPMRHATFTLSPEAIEALNQLSELTGEAKSKIVRHLVLQAMEQTGSRPDVVVEPVQPPPGKTRSGS